MCIRDRLKSNIGAGFLAMPYAFSNFGIVGGCLVLPVIVGVAVVGMRLLVSVKARLRESEYRTKPDSELTYPAIARSLLGGCGEWVVLVSLFISQMGTCCAYLIFWGNTFEDAFPGFPRQVAILLAAGLVLPLCMVTNPRGLRWSSFVGLALGVIALISIYAYNLTLAAQSPTDSAPQDWHKLSTNVEKFPRFFGISTFAMEGITVVLPLEQSARQKAAFPALMTAAMVVCGLVFGSFGALGYAVYGSETHQSVLKNLPSGSP
eukprot:TRINITY_DN5031_c0_g1_i6.p1 TRINITY_DN5031_c0_g1~~TRINITY_DN5031_c0_g1_i6.p1  ORF type:complete len:263 (+),score=57.33 TRINITY_DN5031_c0_g1_i6:110-898(+)